MGSLTTNTRVLRGNGKLGRVLLVFPVSVILLGVWPSGEAIPGHH